MCVPFYYARTFESTRRMIKCSIFKYRHFHVPFVYSSDRKIFERAHRKKKLQQQQQQHDLQRNICYEMAEVYVTDVWAHHLWAHMLLSEMRKEQKQSIHTKRKTSPLLQNDGKKESKRFHISIHRSGFC